MIFALYNPQSGEVVLSLKKKESVRAVERTAEIFRAFSFERQELSLAELCTLVDLPKTTIYRILSTLECQNWVVQDSESGKYRLGYELIKLGSIAQAGNSIQRAAAEDMNRVTKETSQTCNLYIRDGFERLCVAQVVGTEYVRRFSYLGARYPLYCGAGKLLLAFADKEVRDKYFETVKLEKYTENTVIDKEVLKQELEDIVRKGYAVTKGERDEMTAMVSVPIYDYTGKVVASITISGPVYLFSGENVSKYLNVLKQAASNISVKLGYEQ